MCSISYSPRIDLLRLSSINPLSDMDFDIIIPLRNRESVLPISIPLMISQNHLPSLFIIVDSSDNHADVREILAKVFRETKIDTELIVIRSKPGISYQRNLGMRYAQSPVVLFPDDSEYMSELGRSGAHCFGYILGTHPDVRVTTEKAPKFN